MKKILFVINTVTMGGMENVTTTIANHIQGKLDVEIFCLEKNEPFYETKVPISYGTGEKNINLIFRKILTRINGYFFKKETSPFFMNKRKIQSLFNKLDNNKFDIIILVGEIPYYSIELKSRYPELKVILWFHQSFDMYYNHVFRHSKTWFEKALFVSNEVICLTSIDMKRAQTAGFKTTYIYNPLTIDNSKVSALNEKKIAIAGRYAIEQKGLDYLIQISKKLPSDWIIELAGTGSRIQIWKFKFLIYRSKTKNIRLVGALKGNDLKNFFMQSSIYIMTSRWEGMPLVLAEAMSFGLPIIAFEQTGSKEILNNGQYGKLIQLGDTYEFSNQINKFISNPEIRNDYQSKSLTRLKDFDIKIIIENWLQILV